MMLIAGVIVGGLLWLAGYLGACAWWPFANCRRCDGAGKFRSPSGKAWRNCKRCKGSGRRVRFGVRVVDWLRGAGKSIAG
jgi:hypothetical protein